MIVLDASVLIAHLDQNDLLHTRATQLLLSTADEPLAVNPLTLAEVLVAPARKGTLVAVQEALAQLEVGTVPLQVDAPGRLATLRATTRLRLPDCCVLLAAESVKADLATFDTRLAAAAAQIGLVVRG